MSCSANADAVLVLWMASIIFIILGFLTYDGYGFRNYDQQFAQRDTPLLLASIAAMMGEAVLAGAAWIFAWQLLSVDVRITNAECSIEHNLLPGTKTAKKQLGKGEAADESGESSTETETDVKGSHLKEIGFRASAVAAATLSGLGRCVTEARRHANSDAVFY